MYCIYRITNLINGKTYIGKHEYTDESNPMGKYKGSGVLLHKAYKKYGIENFVKDTIVVNIKDKETIDRLETKYIAYERTSNGNGVYNITDGGEGVSGYRHSEEAKTKISASLKGHGCSDETKAKIGAANKGHKHSDESKAKMSAVCKGKKHRPMSDEHRTKLSAAMKGRIPWNKGRTKKEK